MKNISLTVKIWLALSLVSLLLYLVVIFIMPYSIRNFFTSTLMEPRLPSPKHFSMQNQYIPPLIIRGLNIREFNVLEDGTVIPSNVMDLFPKPLLQQIIQNALSQQAAQQYYENVDSPSPIRYVIRKDTVYGHYLYRVILLRKSEEDRFVKTFLFNIMLFAGIALVISLFASLYIARYLTRPLVQMKQHVKRLANRNWHEPLNLKQGDEIGQLASSIETMRQQLVKQDEAQQSMLQNISHELKTPVMVIRSYAQAIKDGVYPKGNLEGSIQVIDEEGARLEKLIKQLLYLTRLDYLAAQSPVQKKIELDKLVEKIFERLYLQRPEITCKLDLQPAIIEGDEEILRVLVENLLENHISHAASCIKISLEINSNKTEVVLNFLNDGSNIEPNILNQIFQPFQKGQEGKYGLGLTIAHRIVKMYRGQITLQNEQNGVSTTVRLPLAAD